jgi:hypothetical protein
MLHLYTTWITLLELLMRAVMKRAMMKRAMMKRAMMKRAMMKRAMWVAFDNKAVFDTKNDRGTALH